MSQTHEPVNTATKLLDRLGAAILTCRTDGGLVELSSSAKQLLGNPTPEVCIAMSADPANLWENVDEIQEWLSTPVEGSSSTCITHARLPDGTTRPFRVYRSSDTDPDGTVNLLVFDATNEMVSHARESQNKRCEAMASTSGAIGHKLNNLLAGLVGYLSLLMQIIPDPSSQVSTYLKALETTTKRIQDLTGQLMIIDRKMSTSNARMQDVSDVVAETVSKTRETLPEATVTFETTNEVPQVLVEKEVFAEALYELVVEVAQLLNVSQAEIVYTSVSLNETRAVFLDVLPGVYTMVRSTLTHPPTTPVVRERIFEPYFAPSGKGKGAELRLSKAWGSIGLHRGTVALSGSVPTETVVEVLLPTNLS